MGLRRWLTNFRIAERKGVYLLSKLLLLVGRDLRWVTVSVAPGVRVRAHSSKESLGYLLDSSFKSSERHFYQRFLLTGEVFVDVGANIGCFSLIAAQVVGPAGHVHAFEPNPKVYREPVDNVSLNGLDEIVTTHPIALTDREGVAPFYARKWSDDFGSLSPAVHDANQCIEVRLARGDTVLDRIAELTLVKIDVEGAEYFVLSGLMSALPHVRYLRIEVHRSLFEPFGVTFGMIRDLLTRFDFRLYRINENALEILPESYQAETREDIFAIRQTDRSDFCRRAHLVAHEQVLG